ncbi:cytochrome P450 11B, mitochondrial-like [Eudromia elegans]
MGLQWGGGCSVGPQWGGGRSVGPQWGGRALSGTAEVSPVSPVSPSPPRSPRPFEAIPRGGRHRWLQLLRVWRAGGLPRFHLLMQSNFQRLGPIYRETLGTYDCVNVLLPQDAERLFQAEGAFPRRMGVEAWSAHRQLRNHKCGVFLLNGEEWRSDRLALNREVISPTGARKFLPLLDAVARDFAATLRRRLQRRPLTLDLRRDLFRFTLEASTYALYGQRLGLLGEAPGAGAARFIGAVETMLRTTLPLLFVPPRLLRALNHRLWRQHVAAWDVIFQHADSCIQSIYREFRRGQPHRYQGIMAELLLHAELPLASIKANLTEFTAGGVDTTAVPLLFTLFELARNPAVQEALRAEVRAADARRPRDLPALLAQLPLLRAALKETLRLYPVGITVQRYPARDVVLQDYHVPAGTLCQVSLYAMGRSPAVFAAPERYEPARWLRQGPHGFRALAFGFGARQCIGRRLAEAEMLLFLAHMLRNFEVGSASHEDVPTAFGFILVPARAPLLTLRPLEPPPQ